jgi:hypothetical protein
VTVTRGFSRSSSPRPAYVHQILDLLAEDSQANVYRAMATGGLVELGRDGSQRFETGEAKQMELAVAKEVCRKAVP